MNIAKYVKRKLKKIIATIRRIFLLKNRDFTIISNNCWGGHVYRYFNLPYQSPTVGLFIVSKDYIKLLKNFVFYMETPITFIEPHDSKYKIELGLYVEKFGQYPIGLIYDVEIHFLHSQSQQEAKTKWLRRRSKINFSKIIFKYSTQNLWTMDDVIEFDRLELENKVLFTSKILPGISSEQILMKVFEGEDNTGDEGQVYHDYMDITKYLNNLKDTNRTFVNRKN